MTRSRCLCGLSCCSSTGMSCAEAFSTARKAWCSACCRHSGSGFLWMRSYTKLERHPELVTGRALFELFCHSQRSGEISRPSIAQAIRRGALTGRLLLLIATDSYAAGFSSSPPPCSASCFCISSCFLALASARFCCFSPISCSAPSSSRTAFSPPSPLRKPV